MNFGPALDKNSVFKIVSEVAHSLNMDSYVVGGYVRDLVLERPNKDIDFVCIGSGIKLAQAVADKLGNKRVTIFKNFGTARMDWEGYELEFVGARKESYREDSRKPLVEDGTLEDDQNRRDFTINALAISLRSDRWGDVLDLFGGVDDINKKIVKTPLAPQITLSDDPLRMMRAIRFATQLNFDIEADTFEAIAASSNRLGIVSMERIIDELNKIILSPTPSYGFKLLFQSGLLNEFFPEMIALYGVESIDNKAHKDNFYHTLQVLDNVSKVSDDLWLRWAAILHDIAKPLTKRFDQKVGWTFHGHEDRGARMVPKLFRRLKLPLDERMDFVQKLIRLHLRPIALVKEVSDSAIRRLLFEAGNGIEALMKLCRADITSKNNDRVSRYLKNFDHVEKKMIEVEEKDRLRNFQPPISGEEIIKFFNVRPGPIIGEIKEMIKDAILDGEIENDHEQAYQLMTRIGVQKGLIKTTIKQ